MLALLLAAGVASVPFTPPQPWALDFAVPPRMPFVGDVNDDGYADLIVVYPPGDSIIDVNLTVEGVKSAGGAQALTGWGQDCQAAAVGPFDDQPGTDVVGIFDGAVLRLAGSFKAGKLKDTPDWIRLPSRLEAPALATLQGGKALLAYSTKTGDAFRVDPKTKLAAACRVPAGLVWIGDTGKSLAAQRESGDVAWLDPRSLRIGKRLGAVAKGSRPAAGPGILAFADRVWTPKRTYKLPPSDLPAADTIRAVGDFDRDGDEDLVEFRNGSEPHTAHQVLLRRAISDGELDPDHDGLSNAEEARRGTDPLNPDTDNDALLDGWEVDGYRGLDMPGLGCDPRHADLLCLVSRFDGVKENHFQTEMKRIVQFYEQLATPNPDGKSGFRFHPILLAPVSGDDTKRSWQENRDRLRPLRWRGVVHWMQVTPGGGGQADELSDGGTCGEARMWAVFTHEFGHQLGLDHNGFWAAGWSPTYPSMMNYNYSYSLEDNPDLIRYSDGSLADYVINESDLDETLPLPYERVKFLEHGPYHFRLKPNGNTTLIDWNWNGVFGEKHVKADINYAYSTNAGRRDDVGKSNTSPCLFVHGGAAYVLFGAAVTPTKAPADPTLGPSNPGRLILRRLKKRFEWEDPWTLEKEGLVGDPVAASFGDKIVAAYPTATGIVARSVELASAGPSMSAPTTVADNPALVPALAEYGERLYLFLTDPATGQVTYRRLDPSGTWSAAQALGLSGTNPVGACVDTKNGDLIVATAENQDAKRPNRWQVRRFRLEGDKLTQKSVEWIEGPDGQTRGTGRLTVLFDDSADAGPEGRVFLFGRGMTSAETPWACTYVAQQIGDKSVKNGWLVKRYYDEWTQTRSAPAAAWFGGDIIWAYRWVDGAQGPTDNNLHVGYNALGIQSEPMGDHNDLKFIRTFGIRNSLLSLGREE